MYRIGSRISLLTGLVTGTALGLAYLFVAQRALCRPDQSGGNAWRSRGSCAATPTSGFSMSPPHRWTLEAEAAIFAELKENFRAGSAS